MVDTVAVPNPPADDENAAAEAAALKAAADGGVVVNGETVQPVDEPKPERPEGVPEKFWDADKGEVKVDAVLASNKELQAQFTKNKQGQDSEGTPDEAEAPAGDQENPVLAAREYYDQNGELSDEHFEALEKAGLPREYVESYIQGQEAIASSVMTHAYSLAGGEEGFTAMQEWAAQNLSEEELSAHNALVINDETSDHAIATLYARYLAERPNETPLIGGDNTPGSAGDFFKSSLEMQEAMADPRYSRDANYRKEVERKIARADSAGVNLFT